MKKLFSILMLASFCLVACNDDDNEKPVGPEGQLVFEEDGVYYLGNGNKEFDCPVGEFTLDASKTYIIRGWVYIVDGATLNIPAGTVLKGKSTDQTVKGSSIIVEPDGKIKAKGTAANPIVFTSDKAPGQRKPGDWGGIIICGKAPNNRSSMQIEGGPRTYHGGSDPADNSGVFKYCRIEFAGYPFDTDKEINGLTLGSVGSGTEIHHVQVSYCNDDSFEWFGGTVNCSHLVAYHGWDDDFDTDNGYSGTLQYLLGIRHPKIADTSASNGFESDNWADGTADATPLTSAKFCNVTLVGPIGQDPEFTNLSGAGNYITAGELNPENGSDVGQFQAGIQIRRSSNISIANTVVMGWPIGIMIENDKGSQTQQMAEENSSRFTNLVFGGYGDNAIGEYQNNAKGASPILGCDRNKTWYDRYCSNGSADGDDDSRLSFSHEFIYGLESTMTFANATDLMLKEPYSVTDGSFDINANMNFGPTGGSPLISDFPVPSGFDNEGSKFIGAFASDSAADNWMLGWTEFDPQNKVY